MQNAATALTAAVVACSTNNGEECYTRRITASDDSCVRGGQHGYEATGHARQNLICTCEIGDLDKKKLRFLLYLMRPGLRNNEFTYHGLMFQLFIFMYSHIICENPLSSSPCIQSVRENSNKNFENTSTGASATLTHVPRTDLALETKKRYTTTNLPVTDTLTILAA